MLCLFPTRSLHLIWWTSYEYRCQTAKAFKARRDKAELSCSFPFYYLLVSPTVRLNGEEEGAKNAHDFRSDENYLRHGKNHLCRKKTEKKGRKKTKQKSDKWQVEVGKED